MFIDHAVYMLLSPKLGQHIPIVALCTFLPVASSCLMIKHKLGTAINFSFYKNAFTMPVFFLSCCTSLRDMTTSLNLIWSRWRVTAV